MGSLYLRLFIEILLFFYYFLLFCRKNGKKWKVGFLLGLFIRDFLGKCINVV